MKEYYKSPVIWYKKLKEDKFADITFMDPLPIMARIEYGRKVVRNPQGKEYVTEALIITDQKIDVGDELEIQGNRKYIINFSENVDLDGKFINREVYI